MFSFSVLELPYESNVGEIKAKVKRLFEDMCDTEDDESTGIDKRRVIVSLDKLELLRGKVCHAELENGSFCDGQLTYEWVGKGTSKTLKWFCSNRHMGEMGDFRNNRI